MKKTFLLSLFIASTLFIKPNIKDPDFNKLLQNIKDAHNLTNKEAQYILQTPEGVSLYHAFKTYTALLNTNIHIKENSVIYAPWRDEYSTAVTTQNNYTTKSCPFCIEPDKDEETLIIKRFKHNFIKLNDYPYTKGHILIIPYAHVKNLNDLSPEARHELMDLISASYGILQTALTIEGANIGINLGRASGASVPDHIHIHVVPRKMNPVGFIKIIGESKVIEWNVQKSYKKIKKAFEKLT